MAVHSSDRDGFVLAMPTMPIRRRRAPLCLLSGCILLAVGCVDLSAPWDLSPTVDGAAPSPEDTANAPALGTGGIAATGGAIPDGGADGVASGGGVATGGAGTGGVATGGTGGVATGGVRSGGRLGTGGALGGQMACDPEGKMDASICWYQGAVGASCNEACSTHGGPSPKAASHVGSSAQGGSLDECARLIALLGMTGSTISGSSTTGDGLGCLSSPRLPRIYIWFSDPDFDPAAKNKDVQLVCGCLR